VVHLISTAISLVVTAPPPNVFSGARKHIVFAPLIARLGDEFANEVISAIVRRYTWIPSDLPQLDAALGILTPPCEELVTTSAGCPRRHQQQVLLMILFRQARLDLRVLAT
jgi:hypothetical protein